MNNKKNAFDWNDGTPSIWSRDKELQRQLIGQEWGRKTQAKVNPNEKREITTYSRAKLQK